MLMLARERSRPRSLRENIVVLNRPSLRRSRRYVAEIFREVALPDGSRQYRDWRRVTGEAL